MQVDFIYDCQVVGSGRFPGCLPRQGELFQIILGGPVYKVDMVKFIYSSSLSTGNVCAKVYLVDADAQTQKKFKYW